MISYRRAVREDTEQLLQLFASQYGVLSPYKGARRLAWQTSNPAWDSEVPPFWVAVDDASGRVVGKIGVQAARLRWNEESWLAHWIVDVLVHNDYRGRGIAQGIHARMAEELDVLLTLTMAPATRRIAEKSGAVTLPAVWQLALPVGLSPQSVGMIGAYYASRRGRLGRALAGYLRSGGGSHVAAAINALWRARYFRRSAAADWRIEPLKTLDDAALLSSGGVSGESVFVLDRDSGWLEWRTNQVPDLEYQFLGLSGVDESQGVAVVRQGSGGELPFLRVLDLRSAGTSPERVASAYRDVVSYWSAKDCGAEWVEAAVSDPAVLAALRRIGFFVTRTHRPTLVTSCARLRRLASSHPWHFSKLDHDWDQCYPRGYYA